MWGWVLPLQQVTTAMVHTKQQRPTCPMSPTLLLCVLPAAHPIQTSVQSSTRLVEGKGWWISVHGGFKRAHARHRHAPSSLRTLAPFLRSRHAERRSCSVFMFYVRPRTAPSKKNDIALRDAVRSPSSSSRFGFRVRVRDLDFESEFEFEIWTSSSSSSSFE